MAHSPPAAVPISGGSVPDAWRDAVIKLWVTIPGYESEVYEATLAEYLAADHRLVRDPPQGD